MSFLPQYTDVYRSVNYKMELKMARSAPIRNLHGLDSTTAAKTSAAVAPRNWKDRRTPRPGGFCVDIAVAKRLGVRCPLALYHGGASDVASTSQGAAAVL
jgi:hypothetical protein